MAAYPQPPPLEPQEIAADRTEIFHSEHIFIKTHPVTGEPRDSILRNISFPSLMSTLQSAGLSSTLTTIFIEIIFRAGDKLTRTVKASLVAGNLGKRRSNVAKYMDILSRIGIVERANPGDRDPVWRFPKYEILVKRVKDWKATNPKLG